MVTLAMSLPTMRLFIGVQGIGTSAFCVTPPNPLSDTLRGDTAQPEGKGFELPERDRVVIERLLDSCQDYADEDQLELAETVERIGLRMTQAYMERARDD